MGHDAAQRNPFVGRASSDKGRTAREGARRGLERAIGRSAGGEPGRDACTHERGADGPVSPSEQPVTSHLI